MIRISDIKIKIEEACCEQSEDRALRKAILTKLKTEEHNLIEYAIFRKSIDARRKTSINYIYTVDAALKNQDSLLARNKDRGITQTPKRVEIPVIKRKEKVEDRTVIIGMGPAGLFAGLILSRHGYNPIILERGEDVDSRTEKINQFWKTGELDPESNVQFGEGGAGTFSDGKLTTLINDRRCRMVLEEFVKAGAPRDILYKAKPHIGTDLLKHVIKNIRNTIISYGGEVRFNSRVTDIIVENHKLSKIIINSKEELNCKMALFAIGHSARDTVKMLYNRGLIISSKSFSIGVRIEHPQRVIDKAQYGDFAGYKGLGPADYKLSYHSKNGRSAYSFCMCPGGYVVAAASEENHLVINGMSEHNRDGENANSALLVGVTPKDFPSDHPLAGIEFQRRWESLAFGASLAGYNAPVQLTGDFLADRPSSQWGSVIPTYKPGVVFSELKNCLPDYVIATLKEAIEYFETKIKGFAMPDSILTGVETRSSSPVRINRDNNYQSSIEGLYPVGEGAGYAGGIMSSAVDGIKVAEKIIEK